MSLRGWSTPLRLNPFGPSRRDGSGKLPRNRSVPACERLEALTLLSGVAPLLITQTVVLPSTYMDVQAAPLGPALQRFDPAAGTLLDVKVISAVSLSSAFKVENVNTSRPAVFTGTLSGNYEIDGLGQAITGSTSASTPVFQASPYDGTTDYAGTSGVTFPTLNPIDSKTTTYALVSDLALFTAANGRTTITPTVTVGSAGNLSGSFINTDFDIQIKGSVSVTVTYEYLPSSAPNPAVSKAVSTSPVGHVSGTSVPGGGLIKAVAPPTGGNSSHGAAGLPNSSHPAVGKTTSPVTGRKPVPVAQHPAPTRHPTGRVIHSLVRYPY